MTYTHSSGTRRLQAAIVALAIIVLAVSLYLNWHSIIAQVVEWQKVFHGLLAGHVRQISQDPLNHGLALIGLSFTYGVFHAIGPGHGKAVIIAYLGSHQETLKRGAFISLLAALLQAVIAILLVAVLAKLLSIRLASANDYADDITTVSYVLVMGLGAYLFATAAVGQWKWLRAKRHSHDHHSHAHHSHAHRSYDHHSHDHHSHDHHSHDHSCCGGHHVHQSSPKESWLKSVGVVFSMGMRPCAGAIIVLIYAHLVDAFFYGVFATLTMGLGTGLSIAGIALGTQLARSWFETLAQSKGAVPELHLGPWLRMGGGVVIFLLGLSLFQAATQMSQSHPLLSVL